MKTTHQSKGGSSNRQLLCLRIILMMKYSSFHRAMRLRRMNMTQMTRSSHTDHPQFIYHPKRESWMLVMHLIHTNPAPVSILYFSLTCVHLIYYISSIAISDVGQHSLTPISYPHASGSGQSLNDIFLYM